MSDKLQRAQHSRARHAPRKRGIGPRVRTPAASSKSSARCCPGKPASSPSSAHVGEDKTRWEEESYARRSIEAADALTSADDNLVDSDEGFRGKWAPPPPSSASARSSRASPGSREPGPWPSRSAPRSSRVPTRSPTTFPTCSTELVVGGLLARRFSPCISRSKKRGQSA